MDAVRSPGRLQRARPELPSLILHPAVPIADYDTLPFATAMNGAAAAWDLASDAPHALVTGATGAGKTSLLRTWVLEAARRDIEVMICDTKRVSLLGLRDWPGVTAYAGEVADMVDLVHRVWTLQEDRYTAILSGDTRPEDLPRVILVIDEAWEYMVRVADAWKEAGEKGTAPGITEFRSLARLGREAHVHLVLGMQRPDAEILSGEARSNFGCRVVLGNADKVARNMVAVTAHITANVRGRAIAAWGTSETECMTWWTPDPRSGRLSPESGNASTPSVQYRYCKFSKVLLFKPWCLYQRKWQGTGR